ncbi:MAG: NAD(P)H-dependent oxidoreductase [Rickettsiales bacterium]|jgi:NAD(P)H dehydrogenase (quinone)|nr:NAD(P)H-dependent oxidoreductase [Rickettsiales bacterium]
MANILIIYGHPKTPASFNADLLARLSEALAGAGHKAAVRDLYSLRFNPVLSGEDMAALYAKTTPLDIKAEQELLAAADTAVFIYPVWWTGAPAIVKGYIDRVFSNGFAYEFRNGKKAGLLAGRKAAVVNSNGNAAESYESGGFYRAMEKAMDDGVLRYAGFDEAMHLFYGSMSAKSAEEKEADIADAVGKILRFIG